LSVSALITYSLNKFIKSIPALEQLRNAQGDESVFARLELLIKILTAAEVRSSQRKSLMQVLSRHLGSDNVLIMFALVTACFLHIFFGKK
jgi:hypothetical protein